MFRESADPVVSFVINNDDAASDSIFTSNSMDVGDSFYGSIDSYGDWDWVALSLDAGETVLIELDGYGFNGLYDTYLYVADENGFILDQNDDAGFNDLSSALTFTATEDSTYYVIAEAYSSQDLGDYVITVSDSDGPGAPPVGPSDDSLISDVLWGTSLDDTTINVYFAPNDYYDYFEGITAEAWNSYERDQVRAALDLIENSVDVDFNIVSSQANADLTLILDLDEVDALGYFNPPDEYNAGTGVFSGYYWDRSAGGDLEVGGFGFVTIVHELLHGLGLAHPHDTGGGSSTIMDGVSNPFDDLGDFDLNQGVFTTMSYNTGLWAGPIGDLSGLGGSYGFEAGPMAIDIAALQSLYGANETHNTGDDVYVIPTSNGTGTYWMSIWDAGGTDMIRYNGNTDALIDLREATLQDEEGGGGFLSGATNVAGGFTIAQGAEIENARSSSGNDLLQGNALNNDLRAGGGRDVVYGADGRDVLHGQGGNDDLFGNSGADRLFGGSGGDDLTGGLGSDVLRGGNGADTMYGGAGNDNLGGGRGSDRLYGGNGNDDLSGGNRNDRLWGGGQRDTLTGEGGNDRLMGGNGRDNLSGNGGNDLLFGGNGNDVLLGNRGADHLTGGSGNDALIGGQGADVFIFNVGMDKDIVRDFNQTDSLEISSALSGGLSVRQIVNMADISGDTAVFDFGNGDELTLRGNFDVNELASMIDIV